MGAKFPGGASAALVNPLPANATETLVATTPPIIPAYDSQPILIHAHMGILAGTGVTQVVLQVRRGPLVTSPAVGGGIAYTLAAGNNAMVNLEALDSGVIIGPTQYSVTIVQTGATAASTMNSLCLWALPL